MKHWGGRWQTSWRVLMGACVGVALLSGRPALATTYFVTVMGVPGEPELETRLSGWAKELDKLVKASPETKSLLLLPPESTKEKLRQGLTNLTNGAQANDVLVLTLIGHGTFDGEVYKFAVPGPDVTAAELGEMLARVPVKRQVVVNTTSASGASIAELRGEGRTLITATRSGNEKNLAVFARYWADAFRDPNADTDKNEVLTAAEAYTYADAKIANFYETQKRLATEHAMLEDTGKGTGVRVPSRENGQGLLARQTNLLRFGAAQEAAKNPEKQRLMARRDELEAQIEKLKYEKAALAEGDYKKQLTALLLQLARLQEEIDK